MDTPQIITKVYDLLLYLIPQISKFPRSQKYVLDDRLEAAVLDVLELLLDATYYEGEVILVTTGEREARKGALLRPPVQRLEVHRPSAIPSPLQND